MLGRVTSAVSETSEKERNRVMHGVDINQDRNELEENKRTIGACVSDFTVAKELGRGSFGVVYKVISNINKKEYVMKKINIKHMDQKHQKEALKEAQILRRVRHDSIIRYYTSFVEHECLYIIMEYADGGDLQQLLRYRRERKKLFSEQEVWEFAQDLIRAVDYLHKNNIIHRDIKTLNIFLTKDRKVKLGDLGVSKIVSSQIALQGTRVGTPLYLAPELVKQQPYDFKVDIWAIGIVLYHICALEPPFQGENLIALGFSIVHKFPKPLSSAFSPKIVQFINKLLEKNPASRPTGDELLDNFSRKSTSTTVSNPSSSPPQRPYTSGGGGGGNPRGTFDKQPLLRKLDAEEEAEQQQQPQLPLSELNNNAARKSPTQIDAASAPIFPSSRRPQTSAPSFKKAGESNNEETTAAVKKEKKQPQETNRSKVVVEQLSSPYQRHACLSEPDESSPQAGDSSSLNNKRNSFAISRGARAYAAAAAISTGGEALQEKSNINSSMNHASINNAASKTNPLASYPLIPNGGGGGGIPTILQQAQEQKEKQLSQLKMSIDEILDKGVDRSSQQREQQEKVITAASPPPQIYLHSKSRTASIITNVIKKPETSNSSSSSSSVTIEQLKHQQFQLIGVPATTNPLVAYFNISKATTSSSPQEPFIGATVSPTIAFTNNSNGNNNNFKIRPFSAQISSSSNKQMSKQQPSSSPKSHLAAVDSKKGLSSALDKSSGSSSNITSNHITNNMKLEQIIKEFKMEARKIREAPSTAAAEADGRKPIRSTIDSGGATARQEKKQDSGVLGSGGGHAINNNRPASAQPSIGGSRNAKVFNQFNNRYVSQAVPMASAFNNPFSSIGSTSSTSSTSHKQIVSHFIKNSIGKMTNNVIIDHKNTKNSKQLTTGGKDDVSAPSASEKNSFFYRIESVARDFPEEEAKPLVEARTNKITSASHLQQQQPNEAALKMRSATTQNFYSSSGSHAVISSSSGAALNTIVERESALKTNSTSKVLVLNNARPQTGQASRKKYTIKDLVGEQKPN